MQKIIKEKTERVMAFIANVKARWQAAYITSAAALCLFLSQPQEVNADLAGKITSGLQNIYGQIFAIVTPLFALICLIGCARIFVNNGRKVDGIMDWLKRAVLAYLAILLLAEIIAFINGVAGKGSVPSFV